MVDTTTKCFGPVTGPQLSASSPAERDYPTVERLADPVGTTVPVHMNYYTNFYNQ